MRVNEVVLNLKHPMENSGRKDVSFRHHRHNTLLPERNREKWVCQLSSSFTLKTLNGMNKKKRNDHTYWFAEPNVLPENPEKWKTVINSVNVTIQTCDCQRAKIFHSI